jgi:hypothetical protein
MMGKAENGLSSLVGKAAVENYTTTVEGFCELHNIDRAQFEARISSQLLGDPVRIDFGDGEIVDGLDDRQRRLATIMVATEGR